MNRKMTVPQKPGGKGSMPMHGKPKMNFKVLGRVIRMLFRFYPRMVPISIVCIFFSAVTAAIPAIFLQRVTQAVVTAFENHTPWELAKQEILPQVLLLVLFYTLALIAVTLETQLAAYITQGFLSKMRKSMFDGMQNLPIRYFDTHQHGDIMSYYTNDIDTLRQLIGQSLPTLIRAGTIVVSVFLIMLWYSVWLTLIVVGGVILMFLVSGKLGGGSAKFFIRQQKSFAAEEGYVQESMNGQKVIKVFNHEGKSIAEFDRLNGELFKNAYRAHAYANMLAPIIMNIGNLLYVVCVIAGCLLAVKGSFNPSVGLLFGKVGATIEVSIIVAFLSMTKQFTGNINQVTQQINSIVMAMAGAGRIFSLIDEQPEPDNGYVTLVNAEIDADGKVTETDRHTGHWAWKHPHGDGTVTYTELKGDVRLTDVDFAYVEG